MRVYVEGGNGLLKFSLIWMSQWKFESGYIHVPIFQEKNYPFCIPIGLLCQDQILNKIADYSQILHIFCSNFEYLKNHPIHHFFFSFYEGHWHRPTRRLILHLATYVCVTFLPNTLNIRIICLRVQGQKMWVMAAHSFFIIGCLLSSTRFFFSAN